MKDRSFIWGLIICIILVVSWTTFWIGELIGEHRGQIKSEQQFHREAIEKGFARYNEKTGIWEWKEAGDLVQTLGIEGKLPDIESRKMSQEELEEQQKIVNSPEPKKKK